MVIITGGEKKSNHSEEDKREGDRRKHLKVRGGETCDSDREQQETRTAISLINLAQFVKHFTV